MLSPTAPSGHPGRVETLRAGLRTRPAPPGADLHRWHRRARLTVWFLLVLLPLGFLLLEARRSHPFLDDSDAFDRGDDWTTYHRFALSVLHGGWTMPAARPNFTRPGGFLYVYFVAGVMGLLGENVTMVYLVQSALLGLAAVVIHVGFGRALEPWAQVVYLATLAAFLYVDAFQHYTHRLLSENLLVAVLPAGLATLVWVRARPGAGRAALAGAVLGAAILTRPNLLALAPAAIALLVAYRRPGEPTLRTVLALAATTGAVLGLMVVRNYALTGVPGAGVLTYTRDWDLPRIAPGAGPIEAARAAAGHYGARLLFALGALPALVPAYRVRPHWLLMWAGVGLFATTAWRRPLAFWEAVLAVTLAVYLLPLLAVAHIASYGFRMLVPALPLALLLAVRGVERWRRVRPAPHPS